MLKLLSLLCFLAAGFLIWQRYAPLPPAPISLFNPIKLSFPDLNISLPVLTVPLTSKGVTYEPHDKNLVFYGHSWPNILGPLKKVQLGQSVHLVYANGQTKKYVTSQIKTVSSNATDILLPTANDQLTIYTCTGFFDIQRLVVVAKPV